ncbi:MAG: TlpA family protein disulfide reductase [Phycisphaerales bacterium]|nr:TlpA family protein disulfide reductase [Phycisphaerales bacterium]
MIRITATLCAAVAVYGAAATLLAAPPTDEQIEQCIKSFSEARTANPPRTMDDMKKLAGEALGDLSVEEMSVDQISTLLTKAPILRYADGAYEKAVARLRTFQSDQGQDGARACVLVFNDDLNAAKTDAEKAAVIHRTLAHPAFDELALAGQASGVFAGLGGVEKGVATLSAEDLGALDRFVTADNAEVMIRSYIELLKAYSTAADKPAANALREKMALLAADMAAGATDERMAKYYTGITSYLNGACARGELLGYKAPEVNITWSSDPSLSSLGALKGEVVVLDFWATWCGPCVASFPNVRELVEHYKGYPVRIVGVTSLQGYHIDSEAAEKRIDTAGDPQKEYALMASYLKSRNITWSVVFTEQEVFNPDYGVRGIPHVAIIGADGKVRHNGLHPAAPLKHKTELIDALLKEAGLPAPAPVVEEPAPGDEG